MTAIVPTRVSAVLVEFDTGTSFSNNFTNVGGTAVTAWNSTLGRGGSGTMFLQSSGHTANVYSGPGNVFSLNAGDSVVASYFFFSSGTRSFTNNVGLYLSNSAGNNPLDAGTTSGVLRTFFFNMDPAQSSPNGTNFRYSNVGGTGSVGTNFPGAGTDFWFPNLETWYQLEVTYTKSGTVGDWDLTAKISNWGADGLVFDSGSLVTLSETVTNSALYNAASISVGLESYQQARGATKIDTFSIGAIPEPSIGMLMGLAGFFLLGRRARTLRTRRG